jgi:hypothetical protein
MANFTINPRYLTTADKLSELGPEAKQKKHFSYRTDKLAKHAWIKQTSAADWCGVLNGALQCLF